MKTKTKSSAAWSLESDMVERYVTWNEAFSPEECAKILKYCKKFMPKDAVIGNDYVTDLDVRKSKVAFITPDEHIAWVYRRIAGITSNVNSQYFNFDLWGFAEGFQFTEYNAPDDHYNNHVDKVLGGVIRKLSFSLQLTDDTTYTGGDFVIIDGKEEKLSRTQGTMLFFPSYQLHRVDPVTEGTRHSLVGWISGKPFK
jgi:PKHD-type hydroxylase